MSIIDPLTCGFSKVAVYNILLDKFGIKKDTKELPKHYKSRLFKRQFIEFNSYFDVENNNKYEIVYKTFTDNFPKILENVNSLKIKQKDTKKEIWDTFSHENWKKLSDKQKHSIFDCQGCLKKLELKTVLAKFPIKSLKHKTKAKKFGLFREQILSDITNTTIHQLDNEFKEKYGTTFTKQAGIKKSIKSDPRKDMRNTVKSAKKDIETQLSETAVER